MLLGGMRAAKVRNAGILLGIGFGGLAEGIVLHPISDSWFQLALWLTSLTGLVALWSAVRGPGPLPSGSAFTGYLLIGWGAFNLAEGLLNHPILGVPLPRVPLHEWGFLLVGGVGFVILGLLLRGSPAAPARERRSGNERRSGSMVR
ncbi:MAG TPA: DUF2243 domain-containing protein [Burkholderiales bacterium]|nr:DUF2243 domain-containing protein [Burkholderiales bacterium]